MIVCYKRSSTGEQCFSVPSGRRFFTNDGAKSDGTNADTFGFELAGGTATFESVGFGRCRTGLGPADRQRTRGGRSGVSQGIGPAEPCGTEKDPELRREKRPANHGGFLASERKCGNSRFCCGEAVFPFGNWLLRSRQQRKKSSSKIAVQGCPS